MAIEIVKLTIALFFVWGFAYYCYRDYRLDMFREEIFIVRSELFEYAATGDVPFDSPAYFLLIKFMNDIIRYAHALTFSRFIIAYTLSTGHSTSTRNTIEEWREALAKIESDDVRNKLNTFHNRTAQSISGQMFRRSVFLFSLALLLRLLHMLLGSGRKPQDMIKKEALEKFESQVIEAEEGYAKLEPINA